MARRKKKKEEKQEDEVLFNVVETTEKAGDFFERNKNLIIAAVVGLFVIVGGILWYIYGYQGPRQIEASELMYQAQNRFSQDSFALALENPGGDAPGFLQIVEDYSGTKAGNLANYYAGICYLNLGKYDAAISYLKDYSPADNITPAHKHMALGDAYSESGDNSSAMSSYKKAAAAGTNEYSNSLALLRLGQFQMAQGADGDAKSTFQKLADKYKGSQEADIAEKYLLRVN